MTRRLVTFAIALGISAAAWANPAPQDPPPPAPKARPKGPDRPPPPGEPPFRAAMPPGTWWRSPDVVQQLGINSDQQKKMEDIFQQHRLKLVDLDAAVRREEITLEPLIAAESPDEAKTLAQIDKVAQARAELEKANARFLFGIRRVLTPDQWKRLQERAREERPPRGPEGDAGPRPPHKERY